MSDRPKCADLFCGAGGAAVGLYRAGFDVEGWDKLHTELGLLVDFVTDVWPKKEENETNSR